MLSRKAGVDIIPVVGAKIGTTSKYRGVTLFAAQGKYQAFVKIDGRRIHCGMWIREQDAALARDRAVLHFGLDGSLNFPRRSEKVGSTTPEELIAEAKAQQRSRETSPYLGVHWDSRRRRWAAIICRGKKSALIAQFDDPEDAAVAYDRVALEWFGRDSERNFPRKRLRPASVDEMREWARKLWKQRTSSRYRGVSWLTRDQTWRAQIVVDGTVRRLGHFDSETEAARAYDREARRALGRKAKLNFPTSLR